MEPEQQKLQTDFESAFLQIGGIRQEEEKTTDSDELRQAVSWVQEQENTNSGQADDFSFKFKGGDESVSKTSDTAPIQETPAPLATPVDDEQANDCTYASENGILPSEGSSIVREQAQVSESCPSVSEDKPPINKHLILAADESSLMSAGDDSNISMAESSKDAEDTNQTGITTDQDSQAPTTNNEETKDGTEGDPTKKKKKKSRKRKSSVSGVLHQEVADGRGLPASSLHEYQWPEGKGDYFILQEQISEYLGVLSFRRKYPDLARRPVEITERDYLAELGVVTETQCDLGLTALRSEEVLDLMQKDYPEKFKDYAQVCQERMSKKRSQTHKDYDVPKIDKNKMSYFRNKAIRSAAAFNTQFMRERREERKAYFDLQTMEVHFPISTRKVLPPELTKVSSYPVALIPGQFQETYKKYEPEELKFFPLGTAVRDPPRTMTEMRERIEKATAQKLLDANKQSTNSQSDSVLGSDGESDSSDSSSDSGSSSSSSDDNEPLSVLQASLTPTRNNTLQATPQPTINTSHIIPMPVEMKAIHMQDHKSPTPAAAASVSEVVDELHELASSLGITIEGESEDLSKNGVPPPMPPLARCNLCNGTSQGNRLGQPEEMVQCSECHKYGHPSCAELTAEMLPVIRTYAWQCMECKTCVSCMDPYDEDKMMFCDHCDRGYHTFCVGLKTIPKGRWECPSCQPDSAAGRTPGKRMKIKK